MSIININADNLSEYVVPNTAPNFFTIHLVIEKPKDTHKFIAEARELLGVESIVYDKKYSILVEKGRNFDTNDVAFKILRLLEEHLRSESFFD